MNFFTKNPNLTKKKNLVVRRGGGGGVARLSDLFFLFAQESKYEKKNLFSL